MRKVYKAFFSNRSLMRSSAIALLMLAASIFANFFAGSFADEKGITPVTDIILSNTRVYDVDWFFIGGMIAFFAFMVIWCLRYPAQIPYLLKSIALFIAIRSVFITLTHLGPYPDSIHIPNTGILGKVNFWADLFFSGHTGMPYLMALMLWNHKWIRYGFICVAVFFGIIVLMGHLHYSIDVLAAFFITYTIHHIADVFFKKDKLHFQNTHSIIHPQTMI